MWVSIVSSVISISLGLLAVYLVIHFENYHNKIIFFKIRKNIQDIDYFLSMIYVNSTTMKVDAMLLSLNKDLLYKKYQEALYELGNNILEVKGKVNGSNGIGFSKCLPEIGVALFSNIDGMKEKITKYEENLNSILCENDIHGFKISLSNKHTLLSPKYKYSFLKIGLIKKVIYK